MSKRQKALSMWRYCLESYPIRIVFPLSGREWKLCDNCFLGNFFGLWIQELEKRRYQLMNLKNCAKMMSNIGAFNEDDDLLVLKAIFKGIVYEMNG